MATSIPFPASRPEDGSPEQMTSGEHNESDVGWSPDGNSLVFGSTAISDVSTSGIHVLDLKTRQSSKLPDSEGLFSPRWSPDDIGTREIYLLDLKAP